MTEQTDRDLALAQKARGRIMAMQEYWGIERFDWALLLELCDTVERLVQERDEARAECERLRQVVKGVYG